MATKRNVYGNTTDITNARGTLGENYNYIDTSAQGYVAPSSYDDSIVVGGTGAVGGVANSGNATRLSGANRAETLKAMQDYIKAQINPTVPNFDSNQYINDTVANGNTGIDEAQKARDAIIDARLQEQTSLQDGQERTVEDNLNKNTESIQASTYDAQETQRATGVQRGIQYSQQQQGLEQGISRAGAKLIVDAKKERDTAILNIRDRIASLKNGASLDKQASASQASSEKAKLLADATDQATKRQWGIDDMRANQAREDAVIQKNFENQLKAMDIEQKNKVALQNLDFEHQKVFMELTNAQQTKIAQMNNSAQMAQTLAQISASKAENNARINAQAQQAKLDRDAQSANNVAKAKAEQNQFLNSFLMNDKTFNPYNLNDAKSQGQLEQLGVLNGVSYDVMKSLVSGNVGALDSVAKAQGVSTSKLKQTPVSPGSALTWGLMLTAVMQKHLKIPMIKVK